MHQFATDIALYYYYYYYYGGWLQYGELLVILFHYAVMKQSNNC
jgi:hypothetical protein